MTQDDATLSAASAGYRPRHRVFTIQKEQSCGGKYGDKPLWTLHPHSPPQVFHCRSHAEAECRRRRAEAREEAARMGIPEREWMKFRRYRVVELVVANGQ
jgi:hypothetical protein